MQDDPKPAEEVAALLWEQVTTREYQRTVQKALIENVPEAFVELLKKLDHSEPQSKL